jgi:hypothetical protein
VTGEVPGQPSRWRRTSPSPAQPLPPGGSLSARCQAERIDLRIPVWARKGQRNVPRDTDPSSRRWKITYTISTGTTVMTTAAKSAPKSTA